MIASSYWVLIFLKTILNDTCFFVDFDSFFLLFLYFIIFCDFVYVCLGHVFFHAGGPLVALQMSVSGDLEALLPVAR